MSDNQYTHSIILQIYNQMVKYGLAKNKRPTTLVIGKKEFETLRKLNLDWRVNNSNPSTLMGFKLEIVKKLDVDKIELK